MQNRVYVYVCGMVRMPFKRARGELFFQKTRLFRLDPSFYSGTTALNKPYFKLKIVTFYVT